MDADRIIGSTQMTAWVRAGYETTTENTGSYDCGARDWSRHGAVGECFCNWNQSAAKFILTQITWCTRYGFERARHLNYEIIGD